MAITLHDAVERLELIKQAIEEMNYGYAANRTQNLIDVLNNSGITIHAIARIESKKVESNDGKEN